MTNAELIVEQLLDLTEEVGTGIYMKQLDSGRQVFSCKCPVCGTIHGGYRTYAEADAHKKCREHFRKEIEKTKKELEKVDEPRKQKNIFQNRLNKPALVGEAEEFPVDDDEDSESWKEVSDLGPDYIAYQVHDGREYYPVSRDGFIGRQGWKIEQLSGSWKVQGMTFQHRSNRPISWNEMRMRINNGERMHGYLWDLDHGTTRRWGRLATVYQLTVNES